MTSAASAPAVTPAPYENSFFKIGKITRVHGVKGEIFVSLCAPEVGSLIARQTVQIKKSPKVFLETTVQEARAHKKGLIIMLKNLKTRQEATGLKGAFLFAPKEVFSSSKGEYLYLCEVLNFTVYDKKTDEALGKIFAFSDHKGQDIMLIQNQKDGKVVQAPFIKKFVKDINFTAKTIQVDLPNNWPGLQKA